MAKYLLKRLGTSIITFVLVSFVVYFLIDATGDPARQALGTDYTEEQYQAKLEEYGLDAPFLARYGTWLIHFVMGDMGQSFIDKGETGVVAKQVISGLGPTFALASISMVVVLVIAIPLGIFAAKHKNGVGDGAVVSASLLGISVPVFVLCAVLMFIFAAKWKVLPVAGYRLPLEGGAGEFIRYMILPVASLSVLNIAYVTRMTRSAMLDVLGTDYIKSAKAKGLRQSKVFYKHALKNALLPVITSMGMTFGAGLGGAVIVETVFGMPGVGMLIVNSIRQKDTPTVMAATLFLAFLFCLVMLIVDILYAYIDPRIKARYQK